MPQIIGFNRRSECLAQPDKSRVYGGTWHEGTFFPRDPATPLTATVQFDGSAVYVFCVLDGRLVRENTYMSFMLDGQAAGVFTRAPSGVDYVYDFLAFSDTSLLQGSHELKITNRRVGGDRTLIILDRIVYSTSLPPDHSSSRNIPTPLLDTFITSSTLLTSRPFRPPVLAEDDSDQELETADAALKVFRGPAQYLAIPVGALLFFGLIYLLGCRSSRKKADESLKSPRTGYAPWNRVSGTEGPGLAER